MSALVGGQVVSRDDELLVLVDEGDRELGTVPKGRAHDGQGMLHRAFSVFVFDPAGRVLLQQRSAGKRLWPNFWSNTCCSHPRPGEAVDQAGRRRLGEELGLEADLRFVYKFTYQADYQALGAEHELCWVYVGRARGPTAPNPTEVSALRWVEPAALDRALAEAPEDYTPWLRLEWRALRGEHWPACRAC